MDERLKDAIQTAVDRRYEENDGPATITVVQIQNLVADRVSRDVSWNELEVTCDELVEEDRLVFLRDHGEDGRRYCSTKVPQATIDLLREPRV